MILKCQYLVQDISATPEVNNSSLPDNTTEGKIQAG
jgi:hypothetical protein